MELWEKEVGQLWGRRPLYIVGESIQPLPHCTSPHKAVLPLGQGGTTAESGTTAPTQQDYRAGEEDRALAPERYYRRSIGGTTAWSGTTATTAATSTVKPDTKNSGSRVEAVGATQPSGTTAAGSRVVLLPWSGTAAPERYYRL